MAIHKMVAGRLEKQDDIPADLEDVTVSRLENESEKPTKAVMRIETKDGTFFKSQNLGKDSKATVWTLEKVKKQLSSTATKWTDVPLVPRTDERLDLSGYVETYRVSIKSGVPKVIFEKGAHSMKGMMKEVVVVNPGKAEVREVPIPQLANEDEVLVKMMSAGVCGSDHHLYHGLNPCSTYPRIPGHENAGIVAKVGANVTNVKVGDHVIIDLISTCGTCYQCTHGRKNVCENVKVRGSANDGGWREYFTAPAKEVYKISDDVKWEDAALVEPYAIGSHCTSRGRVAKDDVVFIQGAGTIGSIILQTCKAKGCKTIICCDISDSALERAREYGADYTINSKKEDVIARVQEITDGHGCTVAFDAACFPGSLTLCLRPGILCNAGRMVPMGFSTVPEQISQAMINQREIDIIGSRMSQNAFEPTIRRMENHEYNTRGIATMFIKFSEVEKVFELMDHPTEESKKMVILFY